MTADPFDSPEVAVRRSKDGRPYVHDPEKGKEALYTRVTTFIDCLDDKTMLAKWAERMAFLGVRSDLSVGKRLMALELVPELSKSPTQEEVVERNGLLDEQKKKLRPSLTQPRMQLAGRTRLTWAPNSIGSPSWWTAEATSAPRCPQCSRATLTPTPRRSHATGWSRWSRRCL